MPYTLMKFLLWALLLAVIGGVIGWLLRSLTCRVEMARLRTVGGDPGELDRLRERSAELDAVVAERDRLRMEIADVRGSSAGTLGFATTVDPDALAAVSAAERTAGQIHVDDVDDVDAGETDEKTATGDPDAAGGLATLIPGGHIDPGHLDERDAADAPPSVALDLDAAAATLGRAVALDDLTVVEGIGPKIAELCDAIGITTWRSLADTEVSTLRSMLDDAGTRFKMHQPDSWPEQAGLLADGRWDDFTALTDRLGSG